MTAEYRYIFLELLTDQVIEEINLYGVSATRQLGSPGQFTGSFIFDQTGKQNIDLVSATTPGRSWLVMEREGVPVWWGIVWSRTYQSQSKSCQIYGWGFEAYPQKQRIEVAISVTQQPNTSLFCYLWQHLQSSDPARNIGVQVPNPFPGTGPLKDFSVLPSDEQFYSDEMDKLANAADGFDWTIDLTKNSDGTYMKSLRVGYPTMGATQGNPDMIVFEYPGAILNYYETESMADAATNLKALGQGEGADMVTSTVVQNDLITLGWPRWDMDVSFKDVSDQSQLDQIALQQGLVHKAPMPTYKITAKADQDPVLGSYNVGDACQLVIDDPRNPSPDGSQAGLDVPSMIIGFQITPPESDSTEEVDIILPGDVSNG